MLPTKFSDVFTIFFRYQSSITDPIANVDNLKDIFENAMAVVGLTKEDVAKAALVQISVDWTFVDPWVCKKTFKAAWAFKNLKSDHR